MELSEMEDIIKQAGWIPIRRKRRKGTLYLYASKRKGGKMVERYIGPASKIQDMTPEQVIAKLEKAG